MEAFFLNHHSKREPGQSCAVMAAVLATPRPCPCQLWTRLDTVAPTWLGVRDPAPQTVPSLGLDPEQALMCSSCAELQNLLMVNIIVSQTVSEDCTCGCSG